MDRSQRGLTSGKNPSPGQGRSNACAELNKGFSIKSVNTRKLCQDEEIAGAKGVAVAVEAAGRSHCPR